MKRVFTGAIPKDRAFFQNLLFELVDDGGLRDYMKGWHDKDGQKFKITIIIERDSD